MTKITMSDDEWRARLTPEQYRVLREQGTERAFAGYFNVHKGDGHYTCAGCGTPLFDSQTKYDSGSGWPSFFAPISDGAVTVRRDTSHGMTRDEVRCGACDGHLGHVFPDGPGPTGARFCMNSVALDFTDRDPVVE
ncbi:MAG: peptide-methionine (R)-S-oxide reductase MsrB [Pseudomonadota bacterium]